MLNLFSLRTGLKKALTKLLCHLFVYSFIWLFSLLFMSFKSPVSEPETLKKSMGREILNVPSIKLLFRITLQYLYLFAYNRYVRIVARGF